MGVHQQYYSKKHPNSSSSTRLLHMTIPSTSSFLYDKNDSLSANPTELDLLNTKKAPVMATNDNNFLNVLPCIRRLYIVFNSICPNIYRIHCSDSFRILQEIICLVEEYLHIHPPRTISTNELLYNEKHFEYFIKKLKHSSSYHIYPNIYSSLTKTEIRCFGQGIHACDDNNELNQTLLFCFELTTLKDKSFSLPIDVLILDPSENIVPTDIKYINTYDHSLTRLYSCSYKPITQDGSYKISFFYNQIKLSSEPFSVFIRTSNQEKVPEMKKTDEQGKRIIFFQGL